MTLGEYLETHDKTPAAFAREIGASRSIVTRWIKRERTPRRETMGLIREATGGKVTPADFFEAA